MELPNAERMLLTKIIDASPEGTYDSIEEEIAEVTNDPCHQIVIEAMHEYARRVLDVAAEEAKVENSDGETMLICEYSVNKDSILRLKELLK